MTKIKRYTTALRASKICLSTNRNRSDLLAHFHALHFQSPRSDVSDSKFSDVIHTLPVKRSCRRPAPMSGSDQNCLWQPLASALDMATQLLGVVVSQTDVWTSVLLSALIQNCERALRAINVFYQA